MISIRTALDTDLNLLFHVDEQACTDRRQRSIRRAIALKTCCVALAGGSIIAYGLLEDRFFDHGFISLIVVGPAYRRRGVGTMLLRHLASLSPTRRLFTSVSLSNTGMQALLEREQFVVSGIVYNLDPNDPELVYFKNLA